MLRNTTRNQKLGWVLFVAYLAVLVYFVLIIMLRAVTQEELKSMPKGHLLIKMGRKMRLLR